MGFLDFIQAVFALAVTLGLVGLGALALRRYGPNAIARFGQPQRRERRLKVVETLILDPARRLLIVECDGQERLLLLGEGRLLGETQIKMTDAR
ncbi:flagellar biosynthetic protein FliO [Phenylobacterium sp. J426]|uniref:flagellar biosynthetic protein FliO n=1 Tax=Phenylobacterium sp. J426 TaxID=2898439 RepID=UPI0021518BCF|nr:flagellar biosynthetic protein FliO [Phenylobacterium sp. J426]MCR5874913.1 flagellar biosynthetic protein FliO [Phenylobacterium sp. J426]